MIAAAGEFLVDLRFQIRWQRDVHGFFLYFILRLSIECMVAKKLTIELDHEADGRGIAEVAELSVMLYGIQGTTLSGDFNRPRAR